jgi:ATP-dependent DNA helicase RecG
MYSLSSPLARVKGIGPSLEAVFAEHGITTVNELLLLIPSRYEDRSARVRIADLKVGETVTLTGKILSPKNFYKGRRSIQSATLADESGKVKLMWFNNPHVIERFRVAGDFLVSGKLNDRGTIVQPTVETFKQDGDSIHTGRLVPIYSHIEGIPAGTLRKLLKEVVDHLTVHDDRFANWNISLDGFATVEDSLKQLHFPENEAKVTVARERLALEELVQLILHSQRLKEQWKRMHRAVAFPHTTAKHSLPFTLTNAQERCVNEIAEDLSKEVAMNRLLLGDVGSGKTAVAGLACQQVMAQGYNCCLVTPTQILAEQHAQSLQKNFPELTIEVVTSQTTKKRKGDDATDHDYTTPTLYVGTHAILSRLELFQPGLLIYDEQHRFGVQQRSAAFGLETQPHILTLTATPIPRTLLLTIFSHLSLSVIDEMPAGRKPVETKLVPMDQRGKAYDWIAQVLHTAHLKKDPAQALVICPFIDPSEEKAFEDVAAATQVHSEIKKRYRNVDVTVELLHGRMKKAEQQAITAELFAQKIDLLVTTPIVEVGLDLPAAKMIIIEAAERFGLASLHQLRGRVGRAGQQAYCLLLTTSEAENVHERLQKFCETHNGLELAEQDLQRRGAGDIFGTQQHGLDQLLFANWTNLELVTKAKRLTDQIISQSITWESPLEKIFARYNDTEQIPMAN